MGINAKKDYAEEEKVKVALKFLLGEKYYGQHSIQYVNKLLRKDEKWNPELHEDEKECGYLSTSTSMNKVVTKIFERPDLCVIFISGCGYVTAEEIVDILGDGAASELIEQIRRIKDEANKCEAIPKMLEYSKDDISRELKGIGYDGEIPKDWHDINTEFEKRGRKDLCVIDLYNTGTYIKVSQIDELLGYECLSSGMTLQEIQTAVIEKQDQIKHGTSKIHEANRFEVYEYLQKHAGYNGAMPTGASEINKILIEAGLPDEQVIDLYSVETYVKTKDIPRLVGENNWILEDIQTIQQEVKRKMREREVLFQMCGCESETGKKPEDSKVASKKIIETLRGNDKTISPEWLHKLLQMRTNSNGDEREFIRKLEDFIKKQEFPDNAQGRLIKEQLYYIKNEKLKRIIEKESRIYMKKLITEIENKPQIRAIGTEEKATSEVR